MQGVEITIVRTGQSDGRLLDESALYIAQCDDNPDVDLTIRCSQAQFDEEIRLLRYAADTGEAGRLAGIAFFQELISRIVETIYPKRAAVLPPGGLLHLRLVTNHKEVAQLPFEFALTPAPLRGTGDPLPFFLNPQLRATLTREVKTSAAVSYAWPADPRILFAWSQPGNTVPHDEHLDAFLTVLRPWALPLKSSAVPVPDAGHLLTELRNASLESIRKALADAAAAGRPYTHVHLLAHGSAEPDPATGQFRLILDDGQRRPRYATGDELSAVLAATAGGSVPVPQVVSLMACDSGNTGSPIHPVGSLAHELHEAGVPCVFASQFPLTQQGSVRLVSVLYEQLLQSADPRLALYCARQQLNAPGTHDWASLLAYARFPEDLDEQVPAIRLKILLVFMKTANALADHVLEHSSGIPPADLGTYLAEVSGRLNSAIDNLTALVAAGPEDAADRDRYAEHYGLIGSALKRKAEHLYRSAAFLAVPAADSREASKAALAQAMDWYRKGFDALLNSHWNGAQYLSLLALLDEGSAGSEDAQEVWMVTKRAAALDEKAADGNERAAWAWGTLAELYLLKPLFFGPAAEDGRAALAQAADYLRKLNALADQPFPKESTARQLERYRDWWPDLLPSSRASGLAAGAAELRGALDVAT